MGIKITELTSACTLVGNELTPLIQSTETRQTAVSSVYTALTAQNDTRYVCGICSSSQGCITFTGAGDGGINLGVAQTSDVIFAGLTANDNSLVDGDLVITSPNKLCSRGDFCSLSGVNLDGTLQANGNTILGNSSTDTLVINGSSITLCNTLPAGTDNSVVIIDSDKSLRTDEIDGKAWGGKLLDYCGTSVGNNKVPKFVGTSGTVEDSIITQNSGTISVGGDLVVTGCFPGSISRFCSDVTMNRGLTVSGNLTVGGSLTLQCLPTSDPLVSGGIWHSGGFLRISCCT